MAAPILYRTFRPGRAPKGRRQDELQLASGQRLGFRQGAGYFARPARQAVQRPSPMRGEVVSGDPSGGDPLVSRASELARAFVQPQLEAIERSASRRQQQGSAAIAGYSRSLAEKFAGRDLGAGYGSAVQDQAAVDQALREALTGTGADAAAGLRERLAAGGVDPAAAEAAASSAASMGQASGATAVGLGSAELGRLVANQAAAREYGGKLPGIAELAGLQDLRSFAGEVAADAEQRTAEASAQIPQLGLALLGDLRDQESVRRQEEAARAASARDAQKVDSQLSRDLGVMVNAWGEAIVGKDGKPVPYKAAGSSKPSIFGSAASGYFTLDPGSGQVRQLTPGSGPRPVAPKIITGADGAKYAFDSGSGQLAQILPGRGPKPRYTPAQVAGFKSTAADTAMDAFWGAKVNPNDPKDIRPANDPAARGWRWLSEPKSYQEAMADLLSHGVPLAVAQGALNRYWSKPGFDADVEARKRGEVVWDRSSGGRGRPVKSFQERQGKAGAAAEPAAARSPAGAKRAAFQIAQQQYGWTGPELVALEQLWTNESGWSYQARNASSGAAGIPQALGHKLPAGYATDPIVQIRWGLDYIKKRYGSPSRALAFWMSDKPANLPQGHWY